jgi:vacuole morphology and inheritance protein 14
MLNSNGLTILKRLCSVLPVTRVYIKCADVLIKMKDVEFISNMINILDIFLLTYKEAESLRATLRKFKNHHKENKNENTNTLNESENSNSISKIIFEKIFTTWSFNPISTLILCIISEYFELSYHLILKL